MRRSSYGKTRIFAKQELRDYLENKKQSILSTIESENDDYLLNVNEDDYIQYKVSAAKVDTLEIHEDDIYASSSEQMIPAEYFPRTFNVYNGKSYKKDVIKFHIPFSGNKDLLSCMPSSRILWSMDVEILNNEFCFEIINFSNDSESIVKDKDSNISNIRQQYQHVQTEIERYNTNLESQVKQAFESRKNKIKEKSGVLASLGVPIKKTSTPPSTFSIPASIKRKKVSVSKPVVKENGFTPEPCLDESIYSDILKMIHDVGKEFERLPSLYAGKEEEHLRDHFLMMLEPNFEGSATGETFNKTGKTDILLRHEGNNVFIGECKFWRGQKSFLDTITQLLG
ncbi:MAG: hypothetical protein OQJ77_04635, partial [Thiovulaceae bacterium]|nr:hypothetical protein [Sulfurimonadaceae bacterium]